MSHINSANYSAEAELFVKNRPYDPNNFGVVLKPDMPEWDLWLRYFEKKGLEAQRSFMRSRWANGYTVPCRRPEEFDPSMDKGPLSQRATPQAPRRETRMYAGNRGEAA